MNIEEIKKNIEDELDSCKDMKSLNDLKVKYLGKKGIITELSSKIKEIPNEEKKEFGMKMNELKTSFNSLYDSKKTFFEEEALNEKLASERRYGRVIYVNGIRCYWWTRNRRR